MGDKMKLSTFAFLIASMAAAPAAAATVAVGYTYEVFGGTSFSSVTAPSLATVPDLDGYDVIVGSTTVALASGATLDFLAAFGTNPTSFTVSDIDPELALDPLNPLAFPLGISLTSFTTDATVIATPITVDMQPVPLPTSMLFLGAGLLAFAAIRRPRSPVSA